MSRNSQRLSVALAVGLFVGVVSSAFSLIEISTSPALSGHVPSEGMSVSKILNSLTPEQKDALQELLHNPDSSYSEFELNGNSLADSFSDGWRKAPFLMQ